MTMPTNSSQSLPETQRTGSLREPGAVLLVSCYELGHQPLGLVTPAARLEAAGFAPILMDLSVSSFDEERVVAASLVGISVPMHTALRLGVRVARRVRALNPRCFIVFYGLYAALNSEYLLCEVADSCLGGEFEDGLLRLAVALDQGQSIDVSSPAAEIQSARKQKKEALLPSREGLLPPRRYVHLIDGDEQRVVGYVASTRGCKHLCLHCPIPAVYHGSFIAVPARTVLDDVAQLVDSGVGHITFGDPDFLNGPAHAARIARAMHKRFPSLTFDYTAKVEHLLRHRALVRELRELGCVFVVSAIESLNDVALANLKKGHTRQDVIEAIRFFRSIDLALRPSLLPFTPWDTIEDYLALLDLIEYEDMIDHVDPVQYGVRLLVPPGSLLLESEAMTPHLVSLDTEGLTWRWRHPDPRMDVLQDEVSRVAEEATDSGQDTVATFFEIKRLAESAAGRRLSPTRREYPSGRRKPPRLSETWFC